MCILIGEFWLKFIIHFLTEEQWNHFELAIVCVGSVKYAILMNITDSERCSSNMLCLTWNKGQKIAKVIPYYGPYYSHQTIIYHTVVLVLGFLIHFDEPFQPVNFQFNIYFDPDHYNFKIDLTLKI